MTTKSDNETDESPGVILESIKKLVSVGLGAAFMTEESIRNYLADLKLPKDVLTFILQGANKGKDELVLRVSKEIGGLLSHVDIVKEASKFAETHKFKISAEIEVLPKKKHGED
jgi:hypothetical protein